MRRHPRNSVLALLLALLLTSYAQADRVLLEHSQNHGAIVRVECHYGEGRSCLGSAMLLDECHALTAHHCVRGGSLDVQLPGYTVQADVIAIHPRNDWALLRFRSPLAGITEAKVRKSPLPLGETVFGFGFGRDVGRFGYTVGKYRGDYIEGRLIEEGDSGGPILDADGRLVGVVTEYDVGTANWRGHAVGSEAFRRFLDLRNESFENVKLVD